MTITVYWANGQITKNLMPLGAKTFVIMIVLLSLQQIMCNVCNNDVMYYNERLNQSLNDALNLQTTALYLQTTKYQSRYRVNVLLE